VSPCQSPAVTLQEEEFGVNRHGFFLSGKIRALQRLNRELL
jgi:hypothetical protein